MGYDVTVTDFYYKAIWQSTLSSPVSLWALLDSLHPLAACSPTYRTIRWFCLCVCSCGCVLFFTGFFSLSMLTTELGTDNILDLIAEYYSYIIYLYKNMHILPSKHYLTFMTVYSKLDTRLLFYPGLAIYPKPWPLVHSYIPFNRYRSLCTGKLTTFYWSMQLG